MPMLISNPFNDHSRDFLVGNELGESYKVVRTVYDNLGALRHISEDPKIQELAGSVSQVSKVAENIDAILRANETLSPELVEILPTVAEQATLALLAAGRAETAERNAQSSMQTAQRVETKVGKQLQQVTQLHQQVNTAYADIKSINQNLLNKVTQVQGIYDVLSPKVDAVLQNHKKIEALAQQVTEDVAHVDMVQGQVNETALQVQTHAQEVKANWLASKEQAAIIDATAKQVASDKTEVTQSKNSANTAANKAKAWAENAEDTPVQLGEYSAKHHALKAKKDAQQVASNTALAQNAATQASKDKDAVASDLVKVTSLRDEVVAKEALVQSAVVEVNLSRDTVLEQAQQVQSNTEAVASNTQQVATNTQAVATNLAKAKQWASEQTDVAVDPGLYSAKHYSIKAGESAEASQASALNAEAQAKTTQADVATIKEIQADVLAKQKDVTDQHALVDTAKAEVDAQVLVTTEHVARVSADKASVEATKQAIDAKALEVNADVARSSAEVLKAKEWASKNQGELVDLENYSAKHYALEAKGYANQASQGQVQADWLDNSLESKGYIKNKPALKALALKDTITTEDIGTGAVTLNTLGSDVKAKLVEPNTFDDLKADIITAITQAGVII